MTDNTDNSYLTAEAKARRRIDAQLLASGWAVQSMDEVNLNAGRGIAVREVRLSEGHGQVDYLLFVDGMAVGALEAKPEGHTLTGVEIQSDKYLHGLPTWVQAPFRPLVFAYESTGAETSFTNSLDPTPRSHRVFAFHRPETLGEWIRVAGDGGKWQDIPTLRSRLQNMPDIQEGHLWPAQLEALTKLESSLANNKPRALIQMATGSGKTYLAANSAYRAVKYADARRVLFLVDRANLGKQAETEFAQYVTPDDGRKFSDLYTVQRLTSNEIDPASRVVVTTIQRLYSMLRGEASFDDEKDNQSAGELAPVRPVEVEYNPDVPPETFEVIVIDEAHRSIYGVWRQVVEYFDAFVVGLTATPSAQTLGFFNQNLVMSYTHEEAVADKVNVDFDVYRIRTRVTGHGSSVEAGTTVRYRDRRTRRDRWEILDDDMEYNPDDLDRQVVAEDQIRTIMEAFESRLFTEIFPGRTTVPKTLIFAKDDSHADDIVRITREVFNQGNDFCQKITYRTTGKKPEEVLAEFQTLVNPRIAVTVDMVATGTDIKPLECVFFMRAVKSRNFFEQMKGRGVRVIDPTDFQAVTPDATHKTHFVIVDAVGVTESERQETEPLDRKRTVSLKKLLDHVALGGRDPDVLRSIASRIRRLEPRVSSIEKEMLEGLAGTSLTTLIKNLLMAVDADEQLAAATELAGDSDIEQGHIEGATAKLITDAVAPFTSKPELRKRLLEAHRHTEQLIDETTADALVEVGFSRDALDRARALVADWEKFILDNKDEITALQVLYNRPYKDRISLKELRELADSISQPPRKWTQEHLWEAYESLESDKVRGSGRRVLTDLVTLVRYTLGEEDELIPFPELIDHRFEVWLIEQEQDGRSFTESQRQWLGWMVDVIKTSLEINKEDFDLPPLSDRGGLGGAYSVFGEALDEVLEELNQEMHL